MFYMVLVQGCDVKSNQESLPDYQLASEFGIEPSELIYQYYQKYGYTDVCEDT